MSKDQVIKLGKNTAGRYVWFLVEGNTVEDQQLDYPDEQAMLKDLASRYPGVARQKMNY